MVWILLWSPWEPQTTMYQPCRASPKLLHRTGLLRFRRPELAAAIPQPHDLPGSPETAGTGHVDLHHGIIGSPSAWHAVLGRPAGAPGGVGCCLREGPLHRVLSGYLMIYGLLPRMASTRSG